MKSIFKNAIIAAAFVFGAASISNAQVKIGSAPNTIDPNNNLEVQATNGNKTTVNKATGQVTIQDGTQGARKILTSDANGNASWSQPNEVNVASLVLRASSRTVQQPSGLFYYPSVAFVDGDASSYNAANGEFTAQSDGFYQFNYSLDVMGPLGSTFTIQVDNLDTQTGPIRMSSTTWNPRTVSGTRFLLAGEKYSPQIYIGGGSPFTSAWKVRNLSIVVFQQ